MGDEVRLKIRAIRRPGTASHLAVVEQETQTFVHAFYDYTPPEGWTFVESASVPPPPS